MLDSEDIEFSYICLVLPDQDGPWPTGCNVLCTCDCLEVCHDDSEHIKALESSVVVENNKNLPSL